MRRKNERGKDNEGKWVVNVKTQNQYQIKKVIWFYKQIVLNFQKALLHIPVKIYNTWNVQEEELDYFLKIHCERENDLRNKDRKSITEIQL